MPAESPPPPRIEAAEVLAGLRENLRARIRHVEMLGFRPSTLAGLAGLSEKALDTYLSDSWNPTPTTMVKADETLARYLPTWIEDAERKQETESGA